MKLYNIRRMSIRDAEAAASLEAASFSLPWTLADFVYEMNENLVARYLVAELDGQMLGFAGAHMIYEEGHVTNVVVAREHRGQGIGRALMLALMQYASNLGVQYLTLEVRASNEAAIALYQSMGFIKVAVRKKYYTDNQEDAWLMVCDKLPAVQDDFTDEMVL